MPACYATHSPSHESVPGIMFEKIDGTWCFLPYALLSAVELISKENLKFHFASGPISVHGRNLELLANPVRTCLLERIWETEKPLEPDRVWVRELLFPKLSTEADLGPLPFPTES
jgi:hypothetical protein